MPYTRDIVVLTKSAKHGGNCVAGIDVNTGEWIRPVKARGPILNSDMTCSNGYICKPLDVVRITFLSQQPNGCQTENEEIDTMSKWIYLDTWMLEDVLRIHPSETHTDIFGNYRCTLYEEEKSILSFSLMLIKVSNLEFYTVEESGKTKANFIYNGHRYSNMSVTDRDFFGCENSFNSGHLVMSIPNDTLPGYNYFKFVAKVFI